MNPFLVQNEGEEAESKAAQKSLWETNAPNATMNASQVESSRTTESTENEDSRHQVDAMNTSVDMTVVQEESMDESNGTEDLKVTLEEAMALRKNLASKFDQEQDSRFQPQTSIRDKIAHFEQKATEYRGANSSQAKKPPTTIVTTMNKTISNDRLKVYLRVRPCATKETSTIEILQHTDGTSAPTTIRTYPPQSSQAAKSTRSLMKGNDTQGDVLSIKEYEFTRVLGPDTSQYDVFQKTTASLANGLCGGNEIGKSALLFCYGVTGSGKTYTTIGDPHREESMGILPRSLSAVLQKVENTDMDVFLSSFEIYNEHLIDLIPKHSENHNVFSTYGASLKIRQDTDGRMIIPGLAEYKIESVKAGMSLIRRAKEARHSETNRVNLHSSRSHSICQLTVRRRIQGTVGDSKENRQSEEAHLWIVDLAGNERTKRTNPGTKSQKEAAYINRSLMCLMRCLTSKTKSYRDSLLTMFFMHHWVNPESSTTMIVNVHGAPSDYDETQHVLSYAISSKSIPIVTSKPNALSKNDEYGYDGRRKGGKPLTMAQKAAKFIRKLSPKRAVAKKKRKNDEMTDTANEMQESEEEAKLVVKKSKREVNPSSSSVFPDAQPPAAPSREVTALQMQLAVAKAEIQSLESKNRELSQQVETMETSVRAQVSDEMLQEMVDMRRRYESTIEKLKESFVQCDKPSSSEQLEKTQSKADELVDKVEECEQEMARMVRIHRSEIKEMEDDHRAEMSVKDKQIAELQLELVNKPESEPGSEKVAELEKQLSERQAEILQLKKSKEELIKNYEKLLASDDDEEEEDTEEEDLDEDNVLVDECVKENVAEPTLEVSVHRKVDPQPEIGSKVQNTTDNAVQRVGSTDDKNVHWDPKMKSMKQSTSSAKTSQIQNQAERKPLQNVNRSEPEKDEESDSDSSFGPSKWLAPRRPATKDPKTGLFARPPGRAPAAADGWDAKKGAWRLSVVS